MELSRSEIQLLKGLKRWNRYRWMAIVVLSVTGLALLGLTGWIAWMIRSVVVDEGISSFMGLVCIAEEEFNRMDKVDVLLASQLRVFLAQMAGLAMVLAYLSLKNLIGFVMFDRRHRLIIKLADRLRDMGETMP